MVIKYDFLRLHIQPRIHKHPLPATRQQAQHRGANSPVVASGEPDAVVTMRMFCLLKRITPEGVLALALSNDKL